MESSQPCCAACQIEQVAWYKRFVLAQQFLGVQKSISTPCDSVTAESALRQNLCSVAATSLSFFSTL